MLDYCSEFIQIMEERGEWRNKEVVTVFVDNLPRSMSVGGFWQLGKREGKVVDAYISRKPRRFKNGPFGFIRSPSHVDAEKIIKALNGRTINGIQLYAQYAKFERNYGRSRNVEEERGRQEWVIKEDRRLIENKLREVGEVAKKKNNHLASTPLISEVVHGEVSEDNLAWLRRSMVGHVKVPIKVEMIRDKVFMDWPVITSIKDLGEYKFLLTFETMEDYEEAKLTGMDLLHEVFDRIDGWKEEEVTETRRVWIECFGLPIHGWSRLNMEKIGEKMGSIIHIENKALAMESFHSFKMLIDTVYMPTINNWCQFTLQGNSFPIHIKEVQFGESLMSAEFVRKEGFPSISPESSSTMGHDEGQLKPDNDVSLEEYSSKEDVANDDVLEVIPPPGFENVLKNQNSRSHNEELLNEGGDSMSSEGTKISKDATMEFNRERPITLEVEEGSEEFMNRIGDDVFEESGMGQEDISNLNDANRDPSPDILIKDLRHIRKQQRKLRKTKAKEKEKREWYELFGPDQARIEEDAKGSSEAEDRLAEEEDRRNLVVALELGLEVTDVEQTIKSMALERKKEHFQSEGKGRSRAVKA